MIEEQQQSPEEMLREAGELKKEGRRLAQRISEVEAEIEAAKYDFTRQIVASARQGAAVDPDEALQGVEELEAEARRLPVQSLAARAKGHSLEISAFSKQMEKANERAEQLREELAPLEEAEAAAIEAAQTVRDQVSHAERQREVALERRKVAESSLNVLGGQTERKIFARNQR